MICFDSLLEMDICAQIMKTFQKNLGRTEKTFSPKVLCRAGYKNESREHDGYFSKIADLPHTKGNLN